MILSIDTSGPLFSIAILNNKYLEIREFEANKAQSERMIIEIQALLKTLSLSFEDVKGVAFGSGPGSFSGVRVACGIAYGIAFAKEIPINGVNTLEALAAINPNKNSISCIADSIFIAFLVTPAPEMFMCVPLSFWFGQNTLTFLAAATSEESALLSIPAK